MNRPDICIAGAGIMGLSLALELDRRGASVVVLEAGQAMRQTSFAAAGMLAVADPANPAALTPLATLSCALYPAYLDRIAELSGQVVPFQTEFTVEQDPGRRANANPIGSAQLGLLLPGHALHGLAVSLISERSVDPRQLGQALLQAVRATSIELREQTPLERIEAKTNTVCARTPQGSVEAPYLIDCMGTWSPAPVFPRKGQMLAVRLPENFDLRVTVRTDEIYIVPRTLGPNAGRAIIGATIEDAGFDVEVHARDILGLHARACRLLPVLQDAEFLESWAGLRPATGDGLPLLGATPEQPRYLLATGHYRNGILLAPATASVLARIVAGEPPGVDLAPFSPARFA